MPDRRREFPISPLRYAAIIWLPCQFLRVRVRFAGALNVARKPVSGALFALYSGQVGQSLVFSNVWPFSQVRTFRSDSVILILFFNEGVSLDESICQYYFKKWPKAMWSYDFQHGMSVFSVGRCVVLKSIPVNGVKTLKTSATRWDLSARIRTNSQTHWVALFVHVNEFPPFRMGTAMPARPQVRAGWQNQNRIS